MADPAPPGRQSQAHRDPPPEGAGGTRQRGGT
jgi:hypothetical protein